MRWTLTIGIDKFIITDEQKKRYVAEIAKGSKLIQLSDKLYVNDNFQSLVEETNPILEDSNYKTLLSLRGKNDDISVRHKMALEKSLNALFPYNKYSKEWDQANSTIKQKEGGEICIL